MLKKLYLFLMFVLLIISGFLSLINHRLAAPLDSLVIIIFALDIFYQFYQSDNKKAFLKKHPLDFIALIPIYTGFRYFKLIPLTLAFLRITTMGTRYVIPVVNALLKSGIGRFAWYFLLVFFLLPLPMIWIEPGIKSYQDLVWWTLQTVTTVGYGDIIIYNPISRIIAGILMFLGIGMISAFTSTITKLMTNPKLIKEEVKKETHRVLEKQKINNEHDSEQVNDSLNSLSPDSLTLDDLYRLEQLIKIEIKKQTKL
ncbi:hypothetical protein CBF34_08225 [Vagococcus penaei]|uniref:Uncharacterized protein n=1 Tax=Vagococcus penaei TaxID=633807 RepID=A0A1Q2D507_9ENTE|nr:potassium channel family protein [Vagococcus penaei]AQP53478.1 hypothetical protein BW732_03960 [Vagococcus penaei]RSU00868.1 hypothetical protein CBF34_08225 [Vagococcus penaei]